MKKNDTVENNAEMINVYLPEHHQNIPARTTESVDDINYKFNLLNGKKPKDFIAMFPFRQPDLSEVKSIVFDRNPQKPEKEEETYHKKTLDELGQEKLEQSLNRVGGKKRGKNYVAPFFKGAGSALYNIGATIHSGLKYMSEDAGVAIFNAIHDADVDLTAEQQRSIRQYWQTQEEIREKLGLKLGKYDSQFSGDLGGGIASMGAALVLSAAYKSPNAAAMVFGMSKTGDVYARLREKGVSAGEALPVATGAGVVEGGIERIGLPIFLRTYGSAILKRKGNAIKAILKQGKIEFLQEGSQSLAGNFLMAPYEEGYQWQEWVDQAMYEGVLAAITAPVAGAATYGMTGELRAKYADIYREKLGLDEQQSKNLAELTVLDRDEALDVITEIADNETIATLFNDNAVNDAEQTLKEGQDLLDKLLAQKALGLSDEVQAKADEFAETMRQQALAAGENEDVADATSSMAGALIRNIAEERVKQGLTADEAVSDLMVDIVGGGNKVVDENMREVPADIFALTDPGYDPVEDYMTPEQRQNEIDEERIATMVEDGGMSVEEATFRVKTGREPTELDKALGYDFIQYQLSPKAYGADGKMAINTPEFKRWFGDSKIVDENGQPLEMVHFSRNKFSQFDKSRAGINNDESAIGFWFADRDDFAFNNEDHPIRYSVYLKMDNPLIIEGMGTETILWDGVDIDSLDPYTKFRKMFDDLMYQDPQMWYERLVESLYGGYEMQKMRVTFANLSAEEQREVINGITDRLKAQGYDGIIIKNTQFDSLNPDERINQYVVFDPNQIKSVYNRGTFDPASDNIYYQFAGEKAETADTSKLNLAKRMEGNGYSNEEIRQQTGWFKGADSKWRFEISDKDAKIDRKTLNLLLDEDHEFDLTLGDLLEHDKLYEAYPDLADMKVEKTYRQDVAGFVRNGVIYINPKTEEDFKSVLMHEIQHAIQHKEDFAKGGNEQMFSDAENRKAFEQLFREEADKKYRQLLMDELYGRYDEDKAKAILDAEEDFQRINKEWDALLEDDAEMDRRLEEANSKLETALSDAGLNVFEYLDIKKGIREKAGLDMLGRSKRAENYDPYELYKQLYGEIEARNTQTRMNMTENERQAATPESTQDVSNADAIVVFDDGSVAAYVPERQAADESVLKASVLEVSTQKEPKLIREDAKKYLKDVVRKQDINHPQLGHIRVSKKGIDEYVSHSGNIDKLALVPHLKNIIETSVVGEKQDLAHPRNDGIIAFYPLYNKASVDGTAYDVTIKIGVDKDGNLFYTLLLDKESSQSGGLGTKSRVAEGANTNIMPENSELVNDTLYQIQEYDDLKSTNTVGDVKKLLKGLKSNEEIRLMYDKNKHYWFAIDADNYIHQDMITKAFKQGLYPEFDSSYEAQQYFDENYNVDNEYLIRFKAESYSSKDDLQNILQDKLNQDEYKVAYSLGDENGKGYVVFARSLYDLSETPLKTIGKDAEVWSRNPYMMTEIKKLSVEDLAQEGIFYQTADGELNLEVTPVRRTTAGQSRQNRMIYQVMGQYEPTKKLITLFEGKDTTTLTHELLHHYLPIYLTELEKAGRFDKLEGLYKELGVSRMADMRREEWEKLVDMGTSYIFYNQAPNEASKSIFERAKQWMMDAYNTVKRFVKPSPEVTKFFDELFTRDASTLPDVSDLKGRSAELAKILQGAKNGQELTVNGLSLRDISRLRQALYARIPAAGKTLADEIRAAGGIDTESELARQLGYDSRKGTEGGFWNYKGEIKDESRLIDFLKANGYLEEVSEKSYEETSSVWDKVQQLIDQRNDTYNEKERSRQMARDSALAAGQVVSEILDQHYIGDVKKLEGDLRAVTKMLADRGAAAVDKATLDYLTFSLKRMEKDYQRLLYQKKEERYNYQEKLTKFIKDLPLDYNHKSKFMDKIRMVKDEKSFNKYLKETKERAEKYIEQEQRRMLSDLIQSEVKSSRPRKVMAQKYDYENNVLFKDLRDYNKMTQGEAAAALAALDENEQNVDNPGSRGYLLRRLFLEYKSNGMDSSPELMRQLYEMIGEAKQLGRESKEESEFEKSFEREQNRQQIIDRLEAAKADKNKWTTKATNVYRRGITNLYSMLNSIAGREIADKYEMETVIDRKEQKEWKHLKKTNAKAEAIYKVKSYGDLLNVMADKGQEVAVLYGKDGKKYDLSVLDIIDIYNSLKNKKSMQDYTEAYGADQINRLISLLSPEDRAFGDMLMEDVNSRFPELNEVYIRTYGMDLKKVENYWMGSAEHIEPVDIFNDFRQQSTTPGFFKERKTGKVTPIAKNAWIKYQKHISQSYYMTDVAEKYKELSDIFKSKRIENQIENHFGQGVYQALRKQIENIGLNAQSPRLDDVSGYFQKLLNNWVGAKVSVNPIVFVGQLTSFTNYAEGVNLSAFIKNIGYALAHPIEVKDFMMKHNGDFLRHRYEAGFNEAMSRFIEGAKETSGKKFGLSAKARFNYSNALSSFVRIGDLGAIIYGGYGQFKTLLDSGMSMEEARRKFEFSTLRSQQSGNAASISDWQQQRGIARLYLAFKNTSLQYTRKIADTVIMLQNGDISRTEAAKVLTNYLLIQPAFWVIAKNIAKSLLGLGDDDDEFDDGVLEQLLANPVDGVPFVSDMVRYAYREAAGEKNYSLFSTPLLDDVEKSFRKIGKEDKDFYDFADIVTPFIEMLTSAPAGTAKRYVKIYNEKWGE